jgi:predicted house-cleaning NTP pyrophosphatase (Maf/HAM1 superfamily)
VKRRDNFASELKNAFLRLVLVALKLRVVQVRLMAKATMQKVASKAVKAHEGRMHKAKSGSSVSKRADGAAIRGKTRGRTR